MDKQTAPTAAPLLLSLDLGMGGMKLASRLGNIQLLSQVSVANGHTVGKMMGLLSARSALRIEIPGTGSFYVDGGSHDAGRPIENMAMDRFQGTPEICALLYGVITRLIQQHGPLQQPVSIIVGLPLQALEKDESAGTIEAIQRWMKGEHHWLADGTAMSLQVNEVKGTSQPAGALFDYVLDGEGKLIPERRPALTSETGIISIGMNTIEMLVVRDKTTLDRFTAGSTKGVRRLLEIFNPNGLYSIGELDLQLRAGRLDLSAALPIWEREVVGEIEKRWDTAWQRFHVVLLVGGGAYLLRNRLPYRFKGKAVMPADPVFSIANGLWKLGLSQQRRAGAA